MIDEKALAAIFRKKAAQIRSDMDSRRSEDLLAFHLEDMADEIDPSAPEPPREPEPEYHSQVSFR